MLILQSGPQGALALRDQSYYIGKTTDPARRWAEHDTGHLKKTPFLRGKTIVSSVVLKQEQTSADELVVTLQTMKEFGVDNVRGGPFCYERLTYGQKEYIEYLLTLICSDDPPLQSVRTFAPSDADASTGKMYEYDGEILFVQGLRPDLPDDIKPISTYKDIYEKIDGYLFYCYYLYMAGFDLDPTMVNLIRSVYDLCYRCGGKFGICGCPKGEEVRAGRVSP